MLGLAETVAIEDAEAYPRGAVVLSLDGTDRAALWHGVVGWGALVFAAGAVAGYLARRWQDARAPGGVGLAFGAVAATLQ